MSIFGKLFKKKQEPPKIVIVDTQPQPGLPVEITKTLHKYQEAIDGLKECLYGTWTERSAEEKKRGITRRKHAKDGWRHGMSHPFVLDGQKYDVQPTNDANVEQFEKLIQLIQRKYHIEDLTAVKKR